MKDYKNLNLKRKSNVGEFLSEAACCVGMLVGGYLIMMLLYAVK